MKPRKFSRYAKEGQNLRREKKEKRRQKAAAATAARLAKKARAKATPQPDPEETEQQQPLNDENDLEFAPPDFSLFGDDDDNRPIFEPLELNIIDQEYDDQPTTSGTVQMEFDYGTPRPTIHRPEPTVSPLVATIMRNLDLNPPATSQIAQRPNILPKLALEQLYKRLKVHRSYRNSFNGNDAAKLLQQWGPMEIAKCVPNSDRVAQIADPLPNLGQIQSAVARFLSDAEIDTARRLVKRFAEKIESTPVKFGPNHFLLSHFVPFLEKWGTLGMLSEQSVEALHNRLNWLGRLYNFFGGREERPTLVAPKFAQQQLVINAAFDRGLGIRKPRKTVRRLDFVEVEAAVGAAPDDIRDEDDEWDGGSEVDNQSDKENDEPNSSQPFFMYF